MLEDKPEESKVKLYEVTPLDILVQKKQEEINGLHEELYELNEGMKE